MRSTESMKACTSRAALEPTSLPYGTSKLQFDCAWHRHSRRWPVAYSLASRVELAPARVCASPSVNWAMQVEQLPERHWYSRGISDSMAASRMLVPASTSKLRLTPSEKFTVTWCIWSFMSGGSKRASSAGTQHRLDSWLAPPFAKIRRHGHDPILGSPPPARAPVGHSLIPTAQLPAAP
ncbi:hypothetical protein D3C78_341360 [compost metagenome]